MVASNLKKNPPGERCNIFLCLIKNNCELNICLSTAHSLASDFPIQIVVITIWQKVYLVPAVGVFVYLLLCVCGLRCLGWRGRSLLLPAEWLTEINVWFAGYLIKDLMLERAPTVPCRTHSKEIALLGPFVHFAFIQACVCKVVVFASACVCVCVSEFAKGQ